MSQLKTTFIARASDGLILCESYDSITDSQTEKLKQNARDLLRKLSSPSHVNNQNSVKSTVEVDDHCFHYSIESGIVYLILAEARYPQKLSFLYLQDIFSCFQQELQNTYGTSGAVDYQSQIECIESSYKFLKFERVINKKRKEYRDAGTKENIEKLNQELVDVKNIMSESFEMLLNRDKNLTKLSELGKNLS